jgi:hypothetical protein
MAPYPVGLHGLLQAQLCVYSYIDIMPRELCPFSDCSTGWDWINLDFMCRQGSRSLLPSYSYQPRLWNPSNIEFSGYGGANYVRVKETKRDSGYSPPSALDVKYARIYASTLVCIFMTWRLMKYKDKPESICTS